MGCQNTKVVAENVEIESKQHIMISYSWESGQKRIIHAMQWMYI